MIDADLAVIRDLGHTCGGTVNNVVLAAVAGALRALLASRDEKLDLVIDLGAGIRTPVRHRRGARQPGGAMLVTLRTDGGLAGRVTRAAAATANASARGGAARRPACWAAVQAAGRGRVAALALQSPAPGHHLRHQPARASRSR